MKSGKSQHSETSPAASTTGEYRGLSISNQYRDLEDLFNGEFTVFNVGIYFICLTTIILIYCFLMLFKSCQVPAYRKKLEITTATTTTTDVQKAVQIERCEYRQLP